MSPDNDCFALNRRDLLARLAASATLLACPPFHALAQSPRSSPRAGRGEFGLWNPLAFGARGNGIANDTAALQRTIDACSPRRWRHRHPSAPPHIPQRNTLALEQRRVPSRRRLDAACQPQPRPLPQTRLAALRQGRTRPSHQRHRDDRRQLRRVLSAQGTERLPIPSPFLGPYDPLYPPAALIHSTAARA